MSKAIKEAGHSAVIVYEARNGRQATTHEKDGYDLNSEGKGEVRHIEVKATAKERIQWRDLTSDEFQAAVSDPHYFLYLVTRAITQPMITEMRRDDLLLRYRGTRVLHVISFPKSLEAKDDEKDEEG